MSTTVKEALIRAKEKIRTPDQWTKGALHRMRSGQPTAIAEDAVCHCMIGAIDAAVPIAHIKLRNECKDAIRPILSRNYLSFSISGFNDDPETTHAMVLNVFDKAIEKQS